MLVGEPGEDPPDPANFPGSTDLDPQFVNALGGDFNLGPASPCIDAGDNGSVGAGVTADLAGRARLQDDPDTPDTGSGVAPMIDMGAYELVLPADIDGDGDRDLDDFAGWSGCMTGPDAGPAVTGCEPYDLDFDTDVDLGDYQAFQRIFQGEEPPFATPATIEGAVTYSGPATGTIHISADKIGSLLTYGASITTPGFYSIDTFFASDYSVSAFMDTNGNGNLDGGEPASAYVSNPVSIASAGQSVAGVNISLGGAFSISGQATYDTGSPAYNITMLLSGAAGDSTSTDSGGNYASPDLADGSYLVTPSSTTKYFYPYDQSADVLGADVTGVDFEVHSLPSGEVDGELTGMVTAVDSPGYSLTIDDGNGPITLDVYVDTIYSGDASSLDEIMVGWAVTAQYYTSANLAVEIDTQSGN